jgi:predicted MPP superfamily phosphohydrolase
VRAAFAFGTLTGIVLSLFMLVMIAAPVLIRLSEKAGLDLPARFLSYIGYTWMGLLFLFVSASLVIDCYRAVLYAAGIVLRKDLSSLLLPGSYTVFIALFLSVIIAVYGYFEAGNIRTETLRIRTSKIPADIGTLRIAQISDVHLGLIVREERLERILKEVKKADPDILVSTGDLVDGQIDNLSGLAEMLGEIKPRFGKFAITGNHEFYAGLDQALNFTERAGFKILRGEGLTVEGLITIAGVDDPQAKSYGLPGKISEKELLSEFPRDTFTVLLKHRPLIDQEAAGLFDLQLSGHVHKGQIFPFSVVTWLYYPTQAGLAMSDNALLYVSRGSGTWGPPIRFLAPPEVTVIELARKEIQ